MEYFELSQPFEGADKTEVSAIDLCQPIAKGVDFGKLCASLAGFVERSQMMAALEVQGKVKQEEKPETEEEMPIVEKAKGFVQICSLGDDDFGSKLIEKFDAVWRKDKQILQRDGKPLSDFDYREIGFKDRLLIAAGYALVFMVS